VRLDGSTWIFTQEHRIVGAVPNIARVDADMTRSVRERTDPVEDLP
jgi:hypothetical protein